MQENCGHIINENHIVDDLTMSHWQYSILVTLDDNICKPGV